MPPQFFLSHNIDTSRNARKNYSSDVPWTIVYSIMFELLKLLKAMMLSQNEFH